MHLKIIVVLIVIVFMTSEISNADQPQNLVKHELIGEHVIFTDFV